jgi:AraC family transcriptional regulator
MVFNQFPDLQWLKNQAESNFANRQAWQGRALPTTGWPTVVLNVQANDVYRDNIRGPLSLFTNFSGVSQVHVGARRTKVTPGLFFISNADQHYTLEIEKRQKAETLNIHFGEYWADQALRSLTESAEDLLNESVFSTPFNRLELHNKLYEVNSSLVNVLHDLKYCADNKLKEEELLFRVLSFLLVEGKQIRESQLRLPSVKNSTRSEIFKRMADATDHIYSNIHRDINLDELASISCLSKFHFLRLFKIAFQKTPHQFVNEVKVKHATALLKTTRLEVKEISRSLGFKDSSTFSRLYFNQMGIYPSQVRS